MNFCWRGAFAGWAKSYGTGLSKTHIVKEVPKAYFFLTSGIFLKKKRTLCWICLTIKSDRCMETYIYIAYRPSLRIAIGKYQDVKSWCWSRAWRFGFGGWKYGKSGRESLSEGVDSGEVTQRGARWGEGQTKLLTVWSSTETDICIWKKCEKAKFGNLGESS